MLKGDPWVGSQQHPSCPVSGSGPTLQYLQGAPLTDSVVRGLIGPLPASGHLQSFSKLRVTTWAAGILSAFTFPQVFLPWPERSLRKPEDHLLPPSALVVSGRNKQSNQTLQLCGSLTGLVAVLIANDAPPPAPNAWPPAQPPSGPAPQLAGPVTGPPYHSPGFGTTVIKRPTIHSFER